MAASGIASVIELDQSDESLGTLTLTATMEASMTGGGDGNAVIRFDAGFPVSAESVSVVGSASVEGHGTALVGGQGTVEVTVGCAEEPALDTRVQVLGGAHGGEAGRLNDDSASLPINQVIPVILAAIVIIVVVGGFWVLTLRRRRT